MSAVPEIWRRYGASISGAQANQVGKLCRFGFRPQATKVSAKGRVPTYCGRCASKRPTLKRQREARYLYLDVKCLGCNTHQTVALNIVRPPRSTSVHELERYVRCKDCSRLQGRPYKRSHLVALRPSKISADEPPSTWWPRER